MFGSWHLGQLQVGLSRAIRLAQCRSLVITARQALPVQIDGEPWRQPAATLHISLHKQVRSSSCLFLFQSHSFVCAWSKRIWVRLAFNKYL